MLKILGRKTSGNTQKVLWCCDELGITYEREDVGREFGKNHEPAYLALNPNGRIPTIEDDGFVLWESNTIVRLCATSVQNMAWARGIHGNCIDLPTWSAGWIGSRPRLGCTSMH
jgi:hypothetical protein